MKRILLQIIAIFFLTIISCNHQKPDISKVKIVFNSKLQEIYAARNSKDIATLSRYLRDDDEYVRQQAVLSIASLGISSNYQLIEPLLTDAVPKVRIAAAYSLGVLGNTKAEGALIKAYSHEPYDYVKKWILEALGNCASEYGVKFLCSLDTKDNKNLVEGQAYAFVRLAQRDILSRTCVNRVFQIIEKSEPNSSLRQIISFFFSSAKSYDFSPYVNSLINIYRSSIDPVVKANLIKAIGRTKNPKAYGVIEQALSSNQREIVVSAIEAAENYPYYRSINKILKLLTSDDYAIALSAADFIEKHGSVKDADKYREIAKNVSYWEVAVKLYAALLKYGKNKADILNTITNAISVSNNVYEKAALIEALGYYPPAYAYVNKIFNSTDEPVIRTACVKSLLKMLHNKHFKYYAQAIKQRNNDDLYTEFYLFFRDAMNTNDNALIYYSAEAFLSPVMKNYITENYENVYFLDNALKTLVFPRDFKTFFKLCQTIKYIENKDCPPSVEIVKSQTDWEFVKNMSSVYYIKLYTTKGEIVVKLNSYKTPMSVAAFIKRVMDKDYNNQKIAKVIPNIGIFIGGKRGDGWETDNFSLINELYPVHFKSGYMAMKSLGQGYQSSLWFITTYPDIAIDNRYTIIGEVVKGIDILDKLTTNDEIISMEILSNF